MVCVLEADPVGKAGEVDQCLSRLRPGEPVVAEDKSHPRQVAILNQGSDLLDLGFEGGIHRDMFLRVEEGVHRLDRLRDTGLGKVSVSLQLAVIILRLEEGHGELAVLHIGDLERIHPKVASSLSEGVERFLLTEIEEGLRHQIHEGRRSGLGLVALDVKPIRELPGKVVGEFADALVDDADVDVHGEQGSHWARRVKRVGRGS